MFPHRQVHLDFHTSPDIPGIGSRFDKKQFQSALIEGNVSSITVFAKCHHGYCYYDTAVGTKHPHLDFDLLGSMIEAAHEIGVRAPIYITSGWSDLDADEHPEWRARKMDGTYFNRESYTDGMPPEAPRGNCSWRDLCLNDGSYCEHIYALTEEICQKYPVDGIFYDICFVNPYCACDECKARMAAEGLDPTSEKDAAFFYEKEHITFMKKCGELIRSYHPEATFFFNSGGADPYKTPFHPHMTHFEMEDLPTAWGGYNKMPLNALFFQQTGKPYMGMTGKFHLDWGEFGGFKSAEALRYEAAHMAVYGASCSIGDHLFPDGEMDMQTYRNIGEAFRYYEQLEPYIFGENTAKVGVYFSEVPDANQGISDILSEAQIDFALVHGAFSEFDTVIFPAKCKISEARVSQLNEYIANGGKVLFCYDSLIKDNRFMIDAGVSDPVRPDDDCDYFHVLGDFGKDLPTSPFLAYTPAIRPTVTDGTVYAETLPLRFNRTYGHFCGHKNTPYDKDGATYPAIVKKGNVVYAAHSLGKIYHEYGSIYHKRCLLDALALLDPQLPLQTDLYAQGRCRMIHQPEENRYCINMTYAAPVRRGLAEIIEDILPIYDRPFTVSVSEKIREVYLPLRGESVPFEEKDGKVTFTLKKLQMHETVVLKY